MAKLRRKIEFNDRELLAILLAMKSFARQRDTMIATGAFFPALKKVERANRELVRRGRVIRERFGMERRRAINDKRATKAKNGRRKFRPD